MAAGESSKPLKPKVPKIHSQAAKAAGAAAMAQLDMQEAKFKSQMTLQRAQVQNKAGQLSLQGNNIDMAMQARADAEAAGMASAGQEPVGPPINVAPLPNGKQSAQGAGEIDISALLQQPGAIAGGAGIQSAMSGGGSAQGDQPQVNPYNITMQNTQGNIHQQISPGMSTNTPTNTTTTRIEPNQVSADAAAALAQAQANRGSLTAYQQHQLDLSSLRTQSQLLADARAADASVLASRLRSGQIARNNFLLLNGKRKATQEIVTQFSQPLADLNTLALEGSLSREEYNKRSKDILSGIPKDLQPTVLYQSQLDLATNQSERTKGGQGTYIMQPDGTTIFSGTGAGKFAANQQALSVNTNRIKTLGTLQTTAQGINLSEVILKDMTKNPSDYGTTGSAKRFGFNIAGIVNDFIPELRKMGYDVPDGAKPEDIMGTIRSTGVADIAKDPNASAAEKKAAMDDWAEITAVNVKYGKTEFIAHLMNALYARAQLGGNLSVRGLEALGRDQFLNPINFGADYGNTFGQLQMLNQQFKNMDAAAHQNWKSMNGGSDVTPGQVLGTEPWPIAEVPKPELTYDDLQSNTPRAHVNDLVDRAAEAMRKRAAKGAQ